MCGDSVDRPTLRCQFQGQCAQPWSSRSSPQNMLAPGDEVLPCRHQGNHPGGRSRWSRRGAGGTRRHRMAVLRGPLGCGPTLIVPSRCVPGMVRRRRPSRSRLGFGLPPASAYCAATRRRPKSSRRVPRVTDPGCYALATGITDTYRGDNLPRDPHERQARATSSVARARARAASSLSTRARGAHRASIPRNVNTCRRVRARHRQPPRARQLKRAGCVRSRAASTPPRALPPKRSPRYTRMQVRARRETAREVATTCDEPLSPASPPPRAPSAANTPLPARRRASARDAEQHDGRGAAHLLERRDERRVQLSRTRRPCR